MDSMITGGVLAQVYINELREETPEGEFWEPKPSWFERFGVDVLARIGLRRFKPVEAAPVAQDGPCPEVRVGALIEG